MSKNIAVLIGCNYSETPYKLNGCQNDVIKYKKILMEFYGYNEENIILLMDLIGYEYPTKQNIIKYMEWICTQTLTTNNISNSIGEITFYYSGHGTNIIDKSTDEPDRFDECIVPFDFDKNGIISDDYIYENFLSKLKSFKKIICIFDSCNSASCTDLPYSFTVMNNRIVKKFYSKRQRIKNNSNIFVLSGCFDPKTSLDTREPNGDPCGLLSYWLRMTLHKYNYRCNIRNLILDIKKGFGSNDQTPVLSVNSNNILSTAIVFDVPNKQKKSIINSNNTRKNNSIKILNSLNLTNPPKFLNRKKNKNYK